MCGIAGVFGPHDEAMLKRMGDAIAHRGPDGEGIYSDGSAVGYAHRRLAIIDRAHGDQPFLTEDGRYAAVYNGEIYNYRELMAELEALGHSFRTVCDTEVVVRAFAQWGEAAFDRFNGMFAVAIHDTQTKTSYLARDHFGIKPIYLAAVGDPADGDGQHRLLFGSEIKAILATGLVEAKPDDATLYRYLRFRIHEDSDRTFFAGIEKVRPGRARRRQGRHGRAPHVHLAARGPAGRQRPALPLHQGHRPRSSRSASPRRSGCAWSARSRSARRCPAAWTPPRSSPSSAG